MDCNRMNLQKIFSLGFGLYKGSTSYNFSIDFSQHEIFWLKFFHVKKVSR